MLIGVSVIAAIVATGIVTWAFGAQGSDEASANGPIIGSSNTSASSTPSPDSTAATSAPVVTTPAGSEPDVAGDDSGQGTDDTASGIADISVWTGTAEHAVTQYLTWDTAEPAATRSARLAPFFAADAPELTSIPVPAGEDLFSYEGFSSTVTVTSIDYANMEGPTSDGTIPILVTASFTSSFTSAIGAQDNVTSSDFTVVVSIEDPKRVISISQH